MSKTWQEIFSDEYIQDNSKKRVRRWSEEYIEANQSERKKLREAHKDRWDIYDYIDNEEPKTRL